jgi:hypothetical protein
MDAKPAKNTYQEFAKILKKRAADEGIDVSRVNLSPDQRKRLTEIINDLLKAETNG